MIAVFFGTIAELNSMEITPESMYKVIKSVEDIRGIKFTAVIVTSGFRKHASNDAWMAYESLFYKENHLFKDNHWNVKRP